MAAVIILVDGNDSHRKIILPESRFPIYAGGAVAAQFVRQDPDHVARMYIDNCLVAEYTAPGPDASEMDRRTGYSARYIHES